MNVLKRWALRLLGITEDFFRALLPIVRSSAQHLLAELAPIALDVVRGYMSDAGRAGADKEAIRARAVAAVRSAALSEGITAGTAAINLAVELAVNALHAESNAAVHD